MINTKLFRYSKQRQKMLEVLQNTKEHPSADLMYEKMKKTFPSISLGTVYRNLGVLNEQGLVNRIMHTGSADRFDADMNDHSHFYCDSCGTIYDIPEESSAHSDNNLADGHKIERQTTSYYGMCRECLNKNNQ